VVEYAATLYQLLEFSDVLRGVAGWISEIPDRGSETIFLYVLLGYRAAVLTGPASVWLQQSIKECM
jgi:hypothetical protein